MGYPAFPSPAQTGTQLASTTTFGVAEVDGSTVTASGGVLSATGSGGTVKGPGSTTVGDFALWNNTVGTLLKDATPAQVTAALNLFTSSLQGLVPAPGGTDDTSGFYLGGDGNWHAVAAQNLALLNTLTASNSANLQDTTSLTSSYSTYLVVLWNIIPATNEEALLLTVQSGGSFKATGYLGAIQGSQSSASWLGSSGVTTSISLTYPTAASANAPANSAPGISGVIRIHNPSASAICMIEGQVGYNSGAGAAAINLFSGYWNTSGAITGIQLAMASGNITSGTAKIYGIT